MTSCDVINQVNRYKIRLQSCHDDDVIIMKTLKKLSHINMTLDILKETRVGRSVNSLKSHEYYGKIAEEIVRKWKLLVPESSSSSRKKKKHHRDVKYDVTTHDDVTNHDDVTTTKHDNDDVTREYDPSGNWQMTKERNDDVSNDDITEYDPTQSSIQEEEESISHTNNKKLKKQRKSGNSGYQPATTSMKQSYEDEDDDEPTPYDPSQQSSSSYKPYQPISTTTSSKSYQPSSKQYKPSSKHHQREEYKPTNDEGGRYISDNSYQPSTNGVTSSAYTSSKHTSSSSYKPSSTATTEEEYNPTTNTDNSDNNNNGYSPYQPTPSNNKMKKKKKLYSMSDSDDDGDVIQEYLPTSDHQQHDSGGYLPQQTKHSSTKHSHNSSKHQQQQVTSHRDNNGGGKIRDKKVKRKMVDDDVIREEPKKKQKTNQQQNKKNKKISAPPSFEDFMAAPVVKKKKKKSIMTSQKSSSKESTTKSSSLKSSSKPVSTSAATVDIKLDLPEIEKIYRPLHHAPLRRKPTTAQQSHNPSGSNDMTDDMAAALHTQRNTGRMQIYSGGNKIHTVPAVYTLRAICIDYLRNNIDRLERINIPFDIIEPILEKCNPEQLDKIESFNNELVDDTHDMWKKHTMMEFKNKKPGHMQSWKELYWELHLQRDQKLEYLKSKIKSKTDKQKPLEKRTKMAFVGIGEAKAPRNVQRAQIKNGTGNAKYIKNVTSSSASSASDIKNVRHQIRMSVPVGRITANSVTSSNNMQRQRSNKKPGKAPLMAKTLKSIGKLRR